MKPSEEPKVGPLSRSSLEEYRGCDFVAFRKLADAFNRALKFCDQIRVPQKPDFSPHDIMEQRYSQRILHRGDVVIPLEDLTAEQRKRAEEVMRSRESTVVEVGEILDSAAGSSERDSEVVELVFQILARKVDTLFVADVSMESLCTTGGIALPFSFESFQTYTFDKIPLGGDQKFAFDEGFRRQRNGWFSNAIVNKLCMRLRDYFLSEIMPLWQGTIYEPAFEFKWYDKCGYRGFTYTDWHGDTYTQPIEYIEKLDAKFGGMRIPVGIVIDEGTGKKRVESIRFVDFAKNCLDGNVKPTRGESIVTFCERDFRAYFGASGRYFSVFFNGDRRLEVPSRAYGHQRDLGNAIIFGFLNNDMLDPRNECFRECPNLGCHVFREDVRKQCESGKATNEVAKACDETTKMLSAGD